MGGAPAPHPAGWPDPHERPCGECGHVWFAGERRHEYVDDGADRPENAAVLCILCRQQKGLERREG